MTRPEFVENEHLEYLDALQDSGATNMFGAAAYIREEFGVDQQTANKILLYWMESYGNPDR